MTENNQCFLNVDIHVMSCNMLCRYISFLHQVDNPSYFCLLTYISIKLTIHHTFVCWYISQSSWQSIILLFIDIYLNQVDNSSYFCLLIYISIKLTIHHTFVYWYISQSGCVSLKSKNFHMGELCEPVKIKFSFECHVCLL